MLGGAVFYIVTNTGTVEIKTEDPTVTLLLEQNGKTITVNDLTSNQTYVVDTGKWTIQLKGNPQGLEIDLPKDRTFEMKRGGTQIVSIRKINEPLAKVVAPPVPPAPVPIPASPPQPSSLPPAGRSPGTPTAAGLVAGSVWDQVAPVPGLFVVSEVAGDIFRGIWAAGTGKDEAVGEIEGRLLGTEFTVRETKMLKGPTRAPWEGKGTISAGRITGTFWRPKSPVAKFECVRQQGWISLTDDGLKEWQQDGNDWSVVGDVRLGANDTRKLIATPGTGILFSAADMKGSQNLVSRRRFEDMALHAEFMVASGTNSGIMFQNHYELQVHDGFGDKKLNPGSCGGLFAVEIDGKPTIPGQGATPRENASRRPGEWQTLDATYRAPRFDSAGTCVAPARFERVIHNGKLIQENAVVHSPTARRGPDVLLLQGGFGPIAFRNVRVRPLAPYFDQLRRDNIPFPDLRAAGKDDHEAAPRELVAVLGDSKLKYWGWVQNTTTLDGLGFSGGGKWLYCVDEGANSSVWVRAWDTDMGTPAASYHVRSRPVGISPRGGLLVLLNKDSAQILQMPTQALRAGKVLYSTPPHKGDISWTAPMGWSQTSVAMVAFSRDEKRIATGSLDKTVFICDAADGKLLRRIEGFPFPVRSVDLNGDGTRLVTTCHGDAKDKGVGEVKLWDAHTGKEVASLSGHNHIVGRVVLSPDSRYVAAATVKIPWHWIWWDVQAPDRPRDLGNSQGDVHFSPDGKRFFMSNTIYDAATAKALCPIQQGEGDRAAWSPDSKRLALNAGFLRLGIYDAATGKPQLAPSESFGPSISTVVSRDGRLIATLSGQWGSQDVKVWTVATGRLLFTFPEKAWWGELSFAPDGSHLAGISLDQKSILVWDTDTGKLARSWKRETGNWRAVAFSPDGRRLAGSSDSEGTKVFDAQSGADICTFRGHQTVVSSLSFSPDGQHVVSVASDNKGVHAKIWDAASGKETKSLPPIGDNQPGQVAFSPDGRHVAVSTVYRACTVFDAQTGKPVLTLPSNPGIAYSPDGTSLAGLEVSKEGVSYLTLWDARTGEPRRQWQLLGGISSVAFAPDGRHLITGNGNGTLYVFRLADAPAVPMAAAPAGGKS